MLSSLSDAKQVRIQQLRETLICLTSEKATLRKTVEAFQKQILDLQKANTSQALACRTCQVHTQCSSLRELYPDLTASISRMKAICMKVDRSTSPPLLEVEKVHQRKSSPNGKMPDRALQSRKDSSSQTSLQGLDCTASQMCVPAVSGSDNLNQPSYGPGLGCKTLASALHVCSLTSTLVCRLFLRKYL